MINVYYIRGYFKVESAFPDSVIQRHIDFVHSVFVEKFGPDVDYESGVDYSKFCVAQAEIVFSRLLSESIVLTGFGVVRKKDEYSERPTDEELFFSARSHVDTATTVLYSLPYPDTTVREVIEETQLVLEGFFRRKKKI